jgi:hypothetical protein
MSRAMLLAALALGLAGCSDDVDLTGNYEIVSNVESAPCGNDTAVVNGPLFLLFHKEDFFGTDYFVFDECMDIEGTDCSSSGSLFSGLFEPIDSGWKGVATSSSHAGTRCLLGFHEATAKLNGSHLVVEQFMYSDEIDLPEDQCTTDEAEKRGHDMTCKEHARIEAEKR